MATPPHSRLPRLVEGIDLRGLPIGPAEAFVLSHVDGSTNETEIADEAGLEPDALSATLETLARLGAIRFEPGPVTESARPTRTRPRVVSSIRIGPIIEARADDGPRHPAAVSYDPREFDEDIDIPIDRRRTILDTFHRLDSLTHYQLLGVEQSADKRAIKNAYYEIVNVFHPDRYFGKKLGSFKPKLERVFTRLTEAHDVLTRGGPRTEYDAYLASLAKTRQVEQASATLQAQVRTIQRQIADEARRTEPAPSALATSPPAPSSAAGESHPSSPASDVSGAAARMIPSQRPFDTDARKRALARKLGGRTLSGNFAALTPTAAPVSNRAVAHERAGQDLKRRYEQRVAEASAERAEQFLVNARQCLASGDPRSAADALRVAAGLVPENTTLAARIQDAHILAESLLAEHYLTQAQYEEREGRMAEAARSYARAALGSPNARTFERAAYCALVASGDLRVASEHARRAVALAPEDAQARLTLAQVFVRAGMKQSALAEFERAATLSPNDDTIRDWIRRLKRGEA